MWQGILDEHIEIGFAHTSFNWSNLASHNAGVTVVIVGLRARSKDPKLLFSLDKNRESYARQVSNINPYLVSGPDVFVQGQRNNLSNLPELERGNSPTDGGYLLLARDEIYQTGLTEEQQQKYIKRFVGSIELIRGQQRFCIWVEDKDLTKAEQIPFLKARFEQVRDFRLKSSKQSTVTAASWPHRFDERKPLPTSPILCVPVTSSVNREYLPVGLLEPKTAISNSSFGMPNKEIWVLSIIASTLSLVWVATVCSRMRTDYRFTNTLAWNTLPVPKLTYKNKMDLTRCAEDILLAREAHFPATIADLYDPENMPKNLRAAHDRNDEVLERIYIGRRFKNDTERLEKLFELYTKMTTKPTARERTS